MFVGCFNVVVVVVFLFGEGGRFFFVCVGCLCLVLSLFLN